MSQTFEPGFTADNPDKLPGLLTLLTRAASREKSRALTTIGAVVGVGVGVGLAVVVGCAVAEGESAGVKVGTAVGGGGGGPIGVGT